MIRNLVKPKHWRHGLGNLNPADVPPQGLNVTDNEEFLFKKFLNGPSFIYCDAGTWPLDISINTILQSIML